MTTANHLSHDDLTSAWRAAESVQHFGAMAEIAARPDCPEALRQVARYYWATEVTAGLARNPTIDQDMIESLLAESTHAAVKADLARNQALTAPQLLRLFRPAPCFNDETRIAFITHRSADDAVIIAAVMAGPLTDKICCAALEEKPSNKTIAAAMLDIAHEDIDRHLLLAVARAAGSDQLAEALEAMEHLDAARTCLDESYISTGRLFALRHAIDATRMATESIYHLIYDHSRGSPAPLRVRW